MNDYIEPIPTQGYVYVMRDEAHVDFYKIGRSKHPEKRLRQLTSKSVSGVSLVHTIKTDHMRGLELQLHERYENSRINGEWFKLSQAELNYLCSKDEINLAHMTEMTYTFGNRLRFWRRHCDITQRQLAEKTGIDDTTISRYEHDRINPTLSTIQRLADGLGVRVSDLTGGGND